MQGSKQTVYLNIVEDFKHKIQLGLIADGEKLPSCRDYAMQKGINPNTVQRAYSTLEGEGFIYAIPKKGVYARSSGNLNELNAAREKLNQLKEAGFTRGQVEELLDEVFGEPK